MTEPATRKPAVPGLIAVAVAITTLIVMSAMARLTQPVHLDVAHSLDRVSETDRSVVPDTRLDVNSASAAELALLPGVGPRLAQRIVADRLANGPFASIDELDRVGGIGPRTIDRLRAFAVIDPMTNEPVRIATDAGHDRDG